MDTTPYQEFAKEKLGFEFNDINLLVTALTHRSYVNEHKKTHEHNERLEFLGDAVLELVSSDFLYRNYNEPEGIMTAFRAALVRTESIGDAGKELGYEPLVRLSKGEKNGSERAHDVILADCFEAVIGAIYLDQGYDVARDFIAKHILVKIDTILEEGSWRDPKSYAQELAQKFDGVTPVYKTLKEEGPDHDKVFTVGLYVGESLKGVGTGHSKQEAQTMAAREGVKGYRKLFTNKPKSR
ncbi:ribonuclease III [Candidatus Nanosyncoccus alces]|uniref:Ribonuclease 3 n=1 Tax=Candidatus Nanosyncoccus alces TaxID=2171997 RepID=A0ABY0FPU3_9BACT|nr:ribonuclease III [Candidatus Nanosyncoccus alces]RYC75203.1 Ribonuclease 3 [Candidatus Nanosyncoccus alces]